MNSKLTILFEAPFWVGLYERSEAARYEVCKITFGAEPKDYEVYEFMLQNWSRLEFSPVLAAGTVPERRINPKRMQRSIRSQLQERGIGTKAQQALQLQREQNKQERRTRTRSGTGTAVCSAPGEEKGQASGQIEAAAVHSVSNLHSAG